MSHEIDITGNVIHMATAIGNRPPWWEEEGFEAQRMPKTATPQEWADAVFGEDYKVRRSPMFFRDPNGVMVEIPNRQALIRSDNYEPLCFGVSNRYHLHQVSTVIKASTILFEEYGVPVSTMGSILGGRKIWVMGSTKESKIVAGERVTDYILLTSPYDLKGTSDAAYVRVMVVCNNTYTYALDKAEDVFRFSHRYEYDPEQVVGDLSTLFIANKNMDVEQEILASKTISKDDLNEFFYRVVMKTDTDANIDREFALLLDKDKEDKGDRASKVQDTVSLIVDSYNRGPGGVQHRDSVPSRVLTFHGATQAINHMVDYKMLVTQKGTSKVNRFERTFLGDGAKMKRRAHELALALVA
jgi:phage/plasmid-like protein (TIGR03299 family)